MCAAARAAHWDVVAVVRSPDAVPGALVVDLRDSASVHSLVESVRPEVIVNCAGLTKARCKSGWEALEVNTLVPRSLGAIAEWHGARLIHISTDCVFSGSVGAPYNEYSIPDAVDVYGRSKAGGELLGSRHLVVRTSFVGHEVGTEHGLLAWLLRQRGDVPGYRNHLWSGVTAPALARALLRVCLLGDRGGLLHLHGESMSKAQLLRMIVRSFRLDVKVNEVVAETTVDRRLMSVRMDSLGLRFPSTEEMVDELARLRWPDD